MKELTQRERQIANYLVDKNKAALNKISPTCVSPLIAVRQVVKADAKSIGRDALKSEQPLTNDEWFKITRWIRDECIRPGDKARR